MKNLIKAIVASCLIGCGILRAQPTNYINNPTIQGVATIGTPANPVAWVVTPITPGSTVINTSSANNTFSISTSTAYTYGNATPPTGSQFGGTWTNTSGSPIFVTLSTGTTFSYSDQTNITGFWVLPGGTESPWFGYNGTNFVVWQTPVAGNSAPYTIASATTTSIQSVPSANISVTGTTTITSFGSGNSGTMRNLTFTGILTLTYNASSLVLPTAANITTAAGDYLTAMSLGGSNWVVIDYQRASGQALASSGFANPMTTTGDMIYSSSGTTPARLAIGSNGNILTVAGGIPTWAAAGSVTLAANNTFTGSNTFSANQTIFSGAYSFGALPSGATTTGATITDAAATITVTGTNTATNFQGIYIGPTTVTDASAGTVSDLSNILMAGPAVGAGSLTVTRPHSLVIVDSTSSASSITGGLVISSVLGTASSSVSFGAGNGNFGASVTAGGTIATNVNNAGFLIEMTAKNTSSGTGAGIGIGAQNGTATTQMMQTGTGSTSAILTGAATGVSGALTTVTSEPLYIGSNSIAGLEIDTSQIVHFTASGSFTANATTATLLGSLGPSGASTTVTKWLTIVDNGGATHYIPCF